MISNTANQTVKIVPDAVFDLGLAIGKVFWDRNEDGIQNNADERGLSFIKIVTEDGKVITTDKDGKFSIPAMKPGRHLLRLDERTLPEGSYLTTPKVVIIDVRPGLPLKANFGVNTNAKIIDESLSKVIMDVDRGRPVPRLSVTARCLKLTDQKQKENCPIEFNIHSNYSNFIEKWELEIIEKESGAVIKTFGGDVSTMDDPIYWEDYEKDKHYEHRLTVYGAKGRHDQTRAQKINFDIEDDDDFSVSENHLEQQSIFIGGETIKVRVPQEGSVVKVVRGEKEYASLEPARYNSDTEFTDVILPSGEYKVVRVENGKVSGRQDIKIGDDYLFFVAMGDAKMGYTTTTGNIEPAQPDDSFRDGFYNEGRLAYYLQGKIKGKYLITSSFDSDREEDDLFKTLEQEKYYPVYGDASSIDYKATDTQGKLYLLIQWDQNEALWGNYQTALNDTELAQFNRTLYGGRVKVKSLSETKDGEARTQVVVFGAEARQLSAHNEFLATGGSLFYVKHKDVIAGSEQVRVEVRDDITGLVISRHDMVNNRDYQFDYDAGRMVFYRPVESVVDSSSIISNALLNGNPVYVVVDYQYEVQDKLTNATAGARVEQALNDYLRVGGTYVEESQANEDYTLRGVDVELSNQSAGQSQGDFEGRLRLEYAESESEAQGNFISTDGGISFTELSTQDDSGGAAYSIEGDVRLFNRAGLRGYYKWIDKEFSTSSISSQQGKEMFDVSGVYDLSS
ncbi:MAG: hypothetical protein KC618_05915, partial [Candidatus Omnitrophica bacterium]|nr:hypothetical protein [Candidatus Omnitrophota bacterium]